MSDQLAFAQSEIHERSAKPVGERSAAVIEVSVDGSVLHTNKDGETLLSHWNGRVDRLPDSWRRLVEKALDSGRVITAHLVDQDPPLAIDFIPMPGSGSVIVLGQDNAGSGRAEVLLEEQSRFITTVFEALDYPFYVIDAKDYTVKLANSAAVEGEFPEGASCFALIHGVDRPCSEHGHHCPLEEIKENKQPLVSEHVHLDKNGDRRVYEVRTHPILDSQGEVSQIIEFALDITGRKSMEEALRERTRQLGERVKELDCLYAISALVERPGITLEGILEGTASVIPPSWQYPEVACARIVLDDREFITDSYREQADSRLSAPIIVGGEQRGLVEVCYLEEKPRAHEGPFLKEERDLIEAIAERLGRIAERLWALEALRRTNDALEVRVRERTSELVLTNVKLQGEVARRRRALEAEEKARRTAEILKDASQALTSTFDLANVLDILLEYLARLIPYTVATVLLPVDERTLRVRAVRGGEQWVEIGRLLDPIVRVENNPHIQQLLTTKGTVIIEDVRSGQEWVPQSYLERVVSWMGVPLLANGKIFGLCSIGKDKPGFFTGENRRLAEGLVNLSAVAVQNARLFEQVRAGRERLQMLSRQLVEIQESERKYISRELHDEAGQVLASLKVGLRLLERDADQADAVRSGVEELKEMVDGIQEKLHRLAVNLRPASLDHVGLVESLRHYVEEFSHNHHLVAQFEVTGLEERLAPEVETAVYRIVQEATTNIARHAQATRVDVILSRRDEKLIVIVEDNGVGFTPREARDEEQLGLFGMRERAEMLGGKMVVECSPGSGTTIMVEIPYEHPHPYR